MKKLLIALLFFASFAHAQNVQWYKQSDTTAAPLGNLYVAGKGFVGGLLEPDSIVTPSLSAGYVPYYSGRLRDSPIYTNGTNVGIGTTASPGQTLTVIGDGSFTKGVHIGSGFATTDRMLEVTGTATGTATTLYGQVINPTFPSTTTGNAYGSYITPATVSASFTLGNAYSLYVDQFAVGSGSAITNNYAIFSNSGTNYFGGNVGIGTTAPTSTLHDAGSFATNLTSPTGNYIATSTDNVIYQSALSLADTVFLPTAAGISGRWYNIMKSDASVNVVTVKASGSELINGANTYALSTQYKFVRIQSNGTQWFIWGSN